jgi:FKBP-type peptidyl-prolyl cis-trans isomerase
MQPTNRLAAAVWATAGVLAIAVGVIAAINGGASSKKPPQTDTQSAPSLSSSESRLTQPSIALPHGAAPKGLVVKDLAVGTGQEVRKGDNLTVHYVEVLYYGGKKVDANWSPTSPFPFTLGKGEVIQGWERGLKGMRVGGRRELIIPASLDYGSAGDPPSIPPNAPVICIVELLSA